MKRIYLDHAATSPLLPAVKRAITSHLATFGNPSSLHQEGRAAKHILDQSREKLADLIAATPDQIIFTASGTESNNMLVNTFKSHPIAASAIEHPSILEPLRRTKSSGILKVDRSARLAPTTLAHALATSRPALVSIMLANNELGTIQDIKSLAALAHAQNARFHTDATQALGKIPIDVRHLDIDFLTISAHKIGGPKGIAALYVKDPATIRPLLHGGHQEADRRASTENLLGIIAFAAAAQIAKTTPALYQSTIAPLKTHLKSRIIKEIPNITINGDQVNTLPHILNISFAGAEGESTLLMLDAAGIAVSTGSACASRTITPSHVLTAIHLDPELAHNSIRFSLGTTTTRQDIDTTVDALKTIISTLRGISTR
jgi:cysteine desulfurase